MSAALALLLTLAAPPAVPPAATPAVPPAATPAAVQRPGAVDWTRRVERTVEGGFRMGNPDAAVRLVEYASITCGHCATFAAEASQPLRARYIRSGRVSWEVRPYLIFPTDPGIFMLLACRGPSAFFDLSDRLYASQSEWSERFNQNRAQVRNGPAPQMAAASVRAAGVDRFFRANGLSAARVTACLGDRAALERMGANSNRYAERDGVTGTPTFTINGRRVDANDWRSLEPLLNQR